MRHISLSNFNVDTFWLYFNTLLLHKLHKNALSFWEVKNEDILHYVYLLNSCITQYTKYYRYHLYHLTVFHELGNALHPYDIMLILIQSIKLYSL